MYQCPGAAWCPGPGGHAPLADSRLVNRNITAGNGRTSMRLEPEMWDALTEICTREGLELRDLIQRVEPHEGDGGRTSAVRVYVMQYYRSAATDAGHLAAGHGAVNGHERPARRVK